MSKLDRSILFKKGQTKIEGLDALVAKFKELTGGKSEAKLVTAMRYALQPLQKQVRANAPRSKSNKNKSGRTGLLKKSIAVKAKKFGRGAKKRIVGLVGPKFSTHKVLKNGLKIEPYRYAHLVERGAVPHVVSPRRKEKNKTFVGPIMPGRFKSWIHPGATAKPFMKPALATVGSQIFNRFAEKVKEIISKIGVKK
jgi:HK97 gp10 family phage protein